MCLTEAVLGNRQGNHVDAFFAHVFNLVVRGVPADPALGRFLVINLAGFLGKCIADVVGVGNKMLYQLRQITADVCILRWVRFGGALYGLGNVAGIYIRSVYCLADLITTANRTAQQRSVLLLLEIGGRRKPSLERVVVTAVQIENDHVRRLEIFRQYG